MIRPSNTRHSKHMLSLLFFSSVLIGLLVLPHKLFQESGTPILQSISPERNESDRGAMLIGAQIDASDTQLVSDPKAKARVSHAYGKLPLSFEANQGQVDGQVRFISRGSGYNLFLTGTEAVLALRASGKTRHASSADLVETHVEQAQQEVLRMKLVGASATPEIKGVDEQPGKSNYFIGDDPRKWRTGVAHYARVQYTGVYPGVNLVYYGNQRQLEYDLVVAPGIDPSVIKLSFDGLRDLRINTDGDLILRTANGEIRQHKPTIYQETNGERKEIAGRYKTNGDREIGFELAAYDTTKPLVIDPVLSYSTYLGGNGSDAGYGIAVDSLGNAYVTGGTASANFPTANSLPYGDREGRVFSEDAFVTKLNAAGSALVYSTYLGGDSGRSERSLGITVDSAGNAYITGYTQSNDFPTANPFQPVLRGGGDAFVTKLNQTGSALVYSTYLGGSDAEETRGIAVDSAGNAYVTGATRSTDFPTANPLQPTISGEPSYRDAFITKLNPAGSALVYSTYLGGGSFDEANAVAVDSSGNAYVTGFTYSNDFPIANALQPDCGCSLGNCAGNNAVFITKINPTGSALVYSTFLGGNGTEEGRGIAVDSSGNVYVTGSTGSTNFPTVNPLQATYSGSGAFCNQPDTFVAKMNAAGSALIYSTYLGGYNSDGGSGIAVDPEGNAYVTGGTSGGSNGAGSPTANAPQPIFGGGGVDAFITKLNPTGSALGYYTYLGGNTNDEGRGIALDSAGNTYVTGVTSGNFPTEKPFQPVFGGGNFNLNENNDAFVAKIGDSSLPVVLSISAVTPNRGGNIGSVSVTIHGSGFESGATAKLVRAGQPDIIATIVEVSEDGTITRVRFDLVGRSSGVRDVIVTNPDGASVTRADAFNVEEGGAPQIWVEIIGRDEIRPGRAQTYYIFYGNRGNTNAYGVPIWITGIPKDAQVDLGFKITPPPQIEGQEPIDYSQIPVVLESDTEKILPLYLPVIRVGQSTSLKITLTVPSERNSELQAFASAPQFSPDANQAAAAPLLLTQNGAETTRITGGCISDLLTLGLNVVGLNVGFNCVSRLIITLGGAFSLIHSAVTTENPEVNDYYSTAQVGFGAVNAALKCAQLPVSQAIGAVNVGLGLVKVSNSCPIGAIGTKIVHWVSSLDPNDKFGAQGVGAGRFLAGEEPLRYAIFFENKPEATAPAQDVVITDQLDPAKLDFDTFSLGPIGFGKDKQIVPPSGLSEFTKDVDLRPANNLIVRVEAKLNKTTGLLTWRFTSLNPATGQPTEDPLAGFLPPNVNAPEGEGQVLFTVRPKEGVATGTEIRNKARIVFDTNAPIDTPEWLNTIDYSKPVSQALPLAAQQNSSRFEVKWSGTDTGSGVQSYTIFVSESGGPFVEWLRDSASTSAFFLGQPGKTYAFYSIARDATGNQEEAPATADAATATEQLVLQFGTTGFTAGEGDGQALFTIARTGNIDAAAINYATSNGTASDRSDYTAALGTLHFAAGESTKSFTVLITDDGFAEGGETVTLTLLNPTGGAKIGNPCAVTLTITDNDAVSSTTSPLSDARFFVRQHYLDFLNRAPDEAGLNFWVEQITSCQQQSSQQAREACFEEKHLNVSAAFFLSIEFQETGYLVYRVYKVAYGDTTSSNVVVSVPVIRLQEFLPDAQRIGQGVRVGIGDWQTQLENNKNAFAREFVIRDRFLSAYPLTMTPTQFIDKLNQNAGGVLSQAERDDLVAQLSAATDSVQGRASVLRKVAEDAELRQRESNRAFVQMQYYGYLRRNPDDPQDADFRGWEFWLNKLNQFSGNFVNAEMVKAFIVSGEYMERFGPPNFSLRQ